MERRLDFDALPPGPLPLDPGTAERLLAGAMADADAPPGYAAVARLLQAAAAPPAPAELAGESEAVASFAAALTPPRRSNMLLRNLKSKTAVAILAGGLTLTGGLAGAGALDLEFPSTTDHPVEVDGDVDVKADDQADEADKADKADKAAEREKAKNDKAEDDKVKGDKGSDDDDADKPGQAANHGAEVSAVAHEPAPEDANHGSVVCEVASRGRCMPDKDKADDGAGRPEAKSFADQIERCDAKGDEKAARFREDHKPEQADHTHAKEQACEEKFEAKEAGADPNERPEQPAKPETPALPEAPGDDNGEAGPGNGKAAGNQGAGQSQGGPQR